MRFAALASAVLACCTVPLYSQPLYSVPLYSQPLYSADLPAATLEAPTWTGSRIAYSENQGLIFVVHRDADQVIALSDESGGERWRTHVGAQPGMVDFVRIGGEPALLVSCEGSGEIWVLDPSTGEVRRRWEVGKGPRGFVLLGDQGRRLAVALFLEHRVAIVDLASGSVVAQVRVGKFPSAVSTDFSGERLYIGKFFSADIDVLNLAAMTPEAPLRISPQANQISSMTWIDAETLVIPHILANTRQPDLHLANTIFPAVSFVPKDGSPSETLGIAFLGEVVNGPEALAVLPKKELLLTVNSRSNDLSIFDLSTGLSGGLIEVGRHPLGIVVRADEKRAYVVNTFDHSISVIDLEERRETARWIYGEDVLPARIARGRALFHDASSLRMVLNQWVSCSNCHPDGRSDGRVWRLPGKPPLRTKSLADFARTRPGGWLASFDEMQDEEIFIREFFLGLGLSEEAPHPHLGESNEGLSADLDALSAYVYSLRNAPSPFLEEGRLSEAAERGREIFFSERTKCASCHPPPFYTTSSLRDPDAGTVANPLVPLLSEDSRALLLEEQEIREARERLGRIDVPSLLGLYREPVFLHDGRAETIAEIFQRWNPSDRHGVTGHLDDGDLHDLERFLLSLPYTDPYTDNMDTIRSPTDWTQWRGDAGGGIAHGTLVAPEAVEEGGPTPTWSRPIGRGFSGISTWHGTLYTAEAHDGEEYLVAIDAETGRERWRSLIGLTLLPGILGEGPRATPAVTEQAVYMVGSLGEMLAADPETGRILWRFSIAEYGGRRPAYGFAASPIIAEDLLIYPAGGDAGRAVVALDRSTGSLRWSAGDGPISYATPTLGELAGRRQVVALTDGGIVSIAPETGRVLWQFAWPGERFESAVSPILLDPDRIFVSANGFGSLLLQVTADGDVRKIWENVSFANDFTTSVHLGEGIFGSGGSSLFGLALDDGEAKWRRRGFQFAFLVGLDTELLLTSDYECRVKLIRPSLSRYDEVAGFTALPFQRCLTSPTVVGNTLYLRNEKNIAAFPLSRRKGEPK